MSVFISYRRDGGQPVAESIYQNLHEDYDVFLDTESLKSGYFDSAIITRIENCTDFIIVITETVFNRCSEPNDWIFHEAQIAMREHKNIIPIFVGIKTFPKNVPDSLQEICRYNGIFWSDSVNTVTRIKSFLLSNRRYILSVIRDGDRAVLSSDTKEELKGLYKRFVKNGRQPVDVDINVLDIQDLANLSIEENIVTEDGITFAKHVAEQTVLQKLRETKNVLEIAVEYLLQDEMIDVWARNGSLKQTYIEKYGMKNCIFTNEDGVEDFYWTPYLWFDIIEEILKEIVSDRYYHYGNSRDYTAIDCYIQTKDGKTPWNFKSFVLNQEGDGKYDEFMRVLHMPLARADYTDLPLHSLAFHVYPDLYYNIGLLKAGLTTRSFDEVNKLFDCADKHRSISTILYYYIGLC